MGPSGLDRAIPCRPSSMCTKAFQANQYTSIVRSRAMCRASFQNAIFSAMVIRLTA